MCDSRPPLPPPSLDPSRSGLLGHERLNSSSAISTGGFAPS